MKRSNQLLLVSAALGAAILITNLSKRPPAARILPPAHPNDAQPLTEPAAVARTREWFEGMARRHARAAPPPPTPPTLPETYRAHPSCHPTLHAGFQGGSLNWGMSFKTRTADECCAACKAHAAVCVAGGGGRVYLNRTTFEGKVVRERCAETQSSNEEGTAQAKPCNVFVFCPTPLSEGGLCWSNDVWNHSYGECWLKNQPRPERPVAGAYGDYPDGYRKKHRTAPKSVQWMSGSLHPGPITVDGPHFHW
ncbi:hypothetical protein AB1Y20_015625 [Prymnesium parvum]|uniref:Apple domain-containing protein n=1 Tax=Prymnesium parvum TaxID=97485 RepID=A0AB34JXB4_PRYPA